MKTSFNAIFQVAGLPFVLARYCFKFSVNGWWHRLTGDYNAHIFKGV